MMCNFYFHSANHFHKKDIYRRTLTEDRPRFVVVFVAIIEWFSSAEN